MFSHYANLYRFTHFRTTESITNKKQADFRIYCENLR